VTILLQHPRNESRSRLFGDQFSSWDTDQLKHMLMHCSAQQSQDTLNWVISQQLRLTMVIRAWEPILFSPVFWAHPVDSLCKFICNCKSMRLVFEGAGIGKLVWKELCPLPYAPYLRVQWWVRKDEATQWFNLVGISTFCLLVLLGIECTNNQVTPGPDWKCSAIMEKQRGTHSTVVKRPLKF